MLEYEIDFLFSLLFTIFVEVIILFFLLKYYFKTKLKTEKIIFFGILASFATLPYLWFIFPFFIRSLYIYIIVGELVVFLVEAFIYHFGLNLSLKRAFFLSLICNLASFLLGLIIL